MVTAWRALRRPMWRAGRTAFPRRPPASWGPPPARPRRGAVAGGGGAARGEPLRLGGEVRYRLRPVTLPDRDNPAERGASEAVALFAARARRADASFALDGETAPVVGRLVARLDGMPLAIELAAARVEALGVAQLLDRIDDRFTLLEAGGRRCAWRAAVACGPRRSAFAS